MATVLIDDEERIANLVLSLMARDPGTFHHLDKFIKNLGPEIEDRFREHPVLVQRLSKLVKVTYTDAHVIKFFEENKCVEKIGGRFAISSDWVDFQKHGGIQGHLLWLNIQRKITEQKEKVNDEQNKTEVKKQKSIGGRLRTLSSNPLVKWIGGVIAALLVAYITVHFKIFQPTQSSETQQTVPVAHDSTKKVDTVRLVPMKKSSSPESLPGHP